MLVCWVPRVVAATVAASVTLAGCGGGEGSHPTTAMTSEATSDSARTGLETELGPDSAPQDTTEADWAEVTEELGRPGTLSGGKVYRVGFPRADLAVTSQGVAIKPGLALGSYAAFARYPDGATVAMGDLVVTEDELQKVTRALHEHGLAQTAIHKHLLAHSPQLWWTHFEGAGKDPAALARGVRAALEETATPAPAKPAPSPADPGIDTAGVDAAMGTAGTTDGGIYKFTFARKTAVSVDGRVLAPAMGVTTAVNFQPTGAGKAAVNGDFVMTEPEVQKVIQALQAGGIDVVELHHHTLKESPRLFYMHFWANADAVKLARTLAEAVASTDVAPVS